MRISTIKGDSGYVEVPPFFRVMIDGAEPSKAHLVHTADEEGGFIVYNKNEGEDDAPRLVMDGDRLADFTQHGVVKIERA